METRHIEVIDVAVGLNVGITDDLIFEFDDEGPELLDPRCP